MAGLDQSDMNPFQYLAPSRLAAGTFSKSNSTKPPPPHNGSLSVPASVMPIAVTDMTSRPSTSNIRPAPGSKPYIPNTSAYFGDISSSYRINPGLGSFEEELPIAYGPVTSESNLRPDLRGQPVGSRNRFPTNESIIGGPAKTDELYERLVQDTSGNFSRLDQQPGVESLTSTPNVKTAESQAGPSSLARSNGKVESDEHGKGKEERVERTTSPGEDTRDTPSGGQEVGSRSKPRQQASLDVSEQSEVLEVLEHGGSPIKESPEHKSRAGDYSYSMDSFDQSYVSEREEVIHLGDDLDIGGSPSPPPRVIESDEDF